MSVRGGGDGFRAVSLVAILSGTDSRIFAPLCPFMCRPATVDALPSKGASLRRASVKTRGVLGGCGVLVGEVMR